jgi:hypothetical protein
MKPEPHDVKMDNKAYQELIEQRQDECGYTDCQRNEDKCTDCIKGSLYSNKCHRDDCGRRNDMCDDCRNGCDYSPPRD